MKNTMTEQLETRAFLSLDEIKQEALKILIAFDSFCTEHGLRYSLAGGTLLGAVRHHGFIPWDDDIDVMMPRPDYERLKALRSEWIEETGYVIGGYPVIDSQDSVFMKLMNERIDVTLEEHDTVLHLGIDVFPVDGLSANDEEVARIYEKAALYRKFIEAPYANPAVAKSTAKRFVKKVYRMLDSQLPLLRSVEKRLNRLAQRRSYENSVYVGAITWGLYGPGERMEKASFEIFDTMEFEGKRFPVVSCWDAYLTGIYGDYMKIPPEADRKSHAMKAWRVNEQEADA